AAPAGEVVSRGAGGQFRGSARRGTIDAAESGGGSCVQGRVTAADGSLFASFYVQVDRGGKTLPAKHFFDTGNYRICGLEAGEWGVAVYAYNDRSTSGAEQQAHQVILRLSGQPGEVFFVDFQANFVPDPPTPTPTTEPPTPTPEPSPYDGVWRGTNSGETTTGPYPPGRFEIEVRNGAIYRISVDGPSCPFETYPNFPNGIKINGNSFGVSGGVFNPITGGNSSHTFSVSGTFVSTSVANGTLSAQLNGAPCANATWSAQK
ncbi:MAG TPA: serine/threonine protein kinase, partial [Roseiflexaceae bacterium]|nr:serine/threonine protein kinase [Roseiflexaceae bacterium]